MTRFRIKYVNLAGEQATTEIEAAQQPDIAEASRLLAERGIGHLQCLDVQPDLVDWARGRTAETIAANRVSGQRVRRWAVGGAITLVLLVVIASASVYGIGRYETWKRWSSFPHVTSACAVSELEEVPGSAVRDISTRPDVPHLTEVSYEHLTGDAFSVTLRFDQTPPAPPSPSSTRITYELGSVYIRDVAARVGVYLNPFNGEWRSYSYGMSSDGTIETLQDVRYSDDSVTFEFDLGEHAAFFSRPFEPELTVAGGMTLSPLPNLLIGSTGETCQWESTASSSTEATDEQSPVVDPVAVFDRDGLIDVPCQDSICRLASPGAGFLCTIARVGTSCSALKGEALVEGMTAMSETSVIAPKPVEGPANYVYLDSTGKTTLQHSTEAGRTRDYYTEYDFGYLRTATANGYTCVTDTKPSDAVSCRHDASGHGFKVSSKTYETF
ncbi:MAG: hypothetical protein LLG14_19535 [Nocardiaceae bacterium]|nr:hypothetical protein [Nocardiaceae bacterium]